MTDLLYLQDSYIQEFQAKVVEIDNINHSIILNQTAFFPGGGGQPADKGKIIVDNQIYPVEKVKKENHQVLHFIEPEHSLPAVGSAVTGKLDWNRRYQMMRTHTAMHILCGVIFRDYGALVTGGDMELLKGRMDFEFATMHKDLVMEIEAAINVEVAKARLVQTYILPRQEAFQIPDLIRTKINLLPESIQEVRVVEITGLDLQADGGTHVSNTAEVGPIRIVDYKSKGQINKRIYLELSQ